MKCEKESTKEEKHTYNKPQNLLKIDGKNANQDEREANRIELNSPKMKTTRASRPSIRMHAQMKCTRMKISMYMFSCLLPFSFLSLLRNIFRSISCQHVTINLLKPYNVFSPCMLIGVCHLFFLYFSLSSVFLFRCDRTENQREMNRSFLFYFRDCVCECACAYYSEIYLPFSIRQSDQYFRCAPINFIIPINLNSLNIEWNTIRSIS